MKLSLKPQELTSEEFADILTEQEVVDALENWGRWRRIEDEIGKKALHPLERIKILFGRNPMQAVSKVYINKDDAKLWDKWLTTQFKKSNDTEKQYWYIVLKAVYVTTQGVNEAAIELNTSSSTISRRRKEAIRWLMHNSRMMLDIYDLEKELIA